MLQLLHYSLNFADQKVMDMKDSKKIAVLFIAALMFSFVAKADSYVLRLYSQEGSVTSWPVSQLQRITFKNGQVAVTLTDGNTSTYATNTTERLSFGLPSGISQLTTDSVRQKSLACIYNLMGVCIARQEVTSGKSIDLSQLPAGIYIVSMDGKKYKIARK